ncbi:SCP2 sterol-binding domain-containing protein [Motiliproteus sp.]|uniref:SCP2 sterol-binding domain-containing protein n=1 Tax=Motiliproteus sp. TaxID=1898955 RepID=UPI003BAA4F93
MSHQQMLDTMVSRFDADAAGDLDAVFQYQLEGDDAFYVTIVDGTCTLNAGEHDDPNATLSLDDETFEELLSGETDGMQAFMAGKLMVTGDMMLATRLTTLFPVS